MHLRQLGFKYGACGPFTKKKERIKKIHDVFIKTNQIKLAFIIMFYGDFNDLPRRTASDKVLRDKASKSTKYNGYQRGFTLILYNF